MISAALGLALHLLAPAPQDAVRCTQIWSVEGVEVRPGMWDYARRYYDTGWVAARREALKRGQIADYRLLAIRGARDKAPQIQLITVYADQAQFDAREANFQAIFRDQALKRPIMIDGKGRDDIFGARAGGEDYGESFGSNGC